MLYTTHITRNPDIMGGKPIIKGTRITVELLLRKMAEGATLQDLLRGYPHLTIEQLYAVLEYAAVVIGNEEVLEV